jgi:hypothetical protein
LPERSVKNVLITVFAITDSSNRTLSLKIKTLFLDQLLQDESDELVRPHTSSSVGNGYQRAAGDDAVFWILVSIPVDKLDPLGNLRSLGVEFLPSSYRFQCFLRRPDLVCRTDIPPFTWYVVRVNIASDSVMVLDFKSGHVGTARQEKSLAMSAVLE